MTNNIGVSFVLGCALFALIQAEAAAQANSKGLPESAATVACKNDDDDCLIRAAKVCQKAKLRSAYSPSPINVTYYSEIRGREKGGCVFYTKIEKESYKYSDADIRRMTGEGRTSQEIQAEERSASEAVRQAEGRDGVCVFDTTKLVQLLEERKVMKQGGMKYSSEDWATCQGPLFNTKLN